MSITSSTLKKLIREEIQKALQETDTRKGAFSAKKHYRQVMDRQSPTLPPIDKDEYPEIHGMEGPFSMKTKSGRTTLYYDRNEGEYYDSKSDMYFPAELLEQGFPGMRRKKSGPPRCSNCGEPNPSNDEGYTECCNDPVVYDEEYGSNREYKDAKKAYESESW